MKIDLGGALRHLALLPIVSALCFSNGTAQEKPFATQGVTEIAGSISFSRFSLVSRGETGDASTMFSLAPQIAYFVADGFEIGMTTGITYYTLLPGFSVITPPAGQATTMLQLFFSPAYNFRAQGNNAYLFIEPQLGYTSTSRGESSASGLSFGGRAGVKVVAAEHLLVTFSGQYLAITLKESGATERSGINYLSFGVGIAGYF